MPTRLAALFFAVILVLVAAGCEDKGYTQATPDDVLKTARLMVKNGDARRLTDLVHADSPQMRAFLDGLGRTLENLADLGLAVQKRFPTEVAALRTEAEQSAKSGQGSSYFGRAIGIASMGRRARRDPAVAQETRELFDKVAMEVMADPYAWLTRNEERLRATTDRMPDGLAVIQWDSNPDSDLEADWKPIFAPLGLTMKEDRGRWFIVLPTNLPGLDRALPHTPEQWEIMSFLLDACDHALIDLRKDVESGRAAHLDDVARMAGEKAFIPVALIMMSYSKATEEARKAARAGASPPEKR